MRSTKRNEAKSEVYFFAICLSPGGSRWLFSTNKFVLNRSPALTRNGNGICASK